MVTGTHLGVLLATVGYLSWAATNVVDKHLLSRREQSGLGFAFLANALIFLISLPLGGKYMFDLSTYALLLSAASGITFFVGLCMYFGALRLGSVSKIVPLTGLTTASALVVSIVAFGAWPSAMHVFGAAVLVVGGFFLGLREPGERFYRDSMLLIAGSTLALGCSYAIQVELYREAPFFSGFACVRGAAFLASGWLLLSKTVRAELAELVGSMETGSRALFVGNQAVGFVGLLLINGALVYTSALVVSALAAVQYAAVAIAGPLEARFGLGRGRFDLASRSSRPRNIGLALIVVGTVLVAF